MALILALAGGAAAQDLAPETILVARLRDHLRDQLGHLPDYTCLENIVRYHRQPGPRSKLLPLDRVRLEVLYSGSHEWYGWPGARSLDEEKPEKFIGSGMIGNGLFALFHKAIFLGDAATYTYRGEERLDGPEGRPAAAKYDIRLPRLRSGQKIFLVGGVGTVGLKGSFWADPRSLDLLRLTVEADEIPAYLPLAEMGARVDYAHTRIGSSDILLAQNADLHMLELSGEENYDRFEFTHCSQFHAESALTFGPAGPAGYPAGPGGHPAANPAPAPAAQPEEEAEEKVPALLLVTVQLQTPIAGNDPLGTPLEGRTYGDVLRKGKVAIPDGSKVRGRIRRLERSDLKPGYFVVGIEFTEIEIRGAPVRFYADLLKLDRRGGIQQALSNRIDRPFYPGVSREALETVSLPEIPGVAAFFVPGRTLALPQGFWTVWRTRGLLHQ
ncbi:MAG: hypothetical protein ACLQU1_22560 [Bryobacteraceae bacterium]